MCFLLLQYDAHTPLSRGWWWMWYINAVVADACYYIQLGLVAFCVTFLVIGSVTYYKRT